MDKQPTILNKCYDLLKLTLEMTTNFPRKHKFLLGDRMQNLTSDLLECFIEAYYAPRNQKKALLQKANIQLEKLRYYFRLCYDMGLYNSKKYTFLIEKLTEIGRMNGGWLKSLN